MGKGILISLLIMVIGVAWVLNTLHFIAGVDWIWTLALGATGVLMIAWPKLNKITFIVGTFLIVGSIFSVARQTNLISVDVEVPVLVIIFGLLVLIAQLPFIPHPQIVQQMKEEEAKRQKESK